MRVISLNIFGGFLFEPLMDFIKTESPTTDVFCLQEVTSAPICTQLTGGRGLRRNMLQELSLALPDFVPLHAPVQDDFEVEFIAGEPMTTGTATFVRKSLALEHTGDFFIANHYNAVINHDCELLGSNVLYTTVVKDHERYTICNLHGVPLPADKLDSPKRLEQSKRVLEFLNTVSGKKIIVGDFNLNPDTQSIRTFEESGFENLIKKYSVTTTRGSMMRKLHPQYEFGKYGFQDFADYAFITPDIVVQSFAVPDIGVSDHLPMILECI